MTLDITNDASKRRVVRVDDSREFDLLARNLHPHDIIVVDNAFAFFPDRMLLNSTQKWSDSVERKAYIVPLSVTRQYEDPIRAYRNCFLSAVDDDTEVWLNIDINSPIGRKLIRCEHDKIIDALGADRSHSRVKQFLEHQPSSLVSLIVTAKVYGEYYGLCIDTGARILPLDVTRLCSTNSLFRHMDNQFTDVYYIWQYILDGVSFALRSDVSVVVQGSLEWFGTINLLNTAIANIESNLGLGALTHYEIYAVDNSIAYCVIRTIGGPGFKDTMETIRTFFGTKKLSVFYDKDVTYCATTNRLTYQEKREAKYRQAARHHTIIDICIAMYPLRLPNYVMLEIIEHLPMMWLQGHRQKIEAIYNCTNSICHVMEQRNANQNKKQKS